ncbi:MAG: trimethylamine methyltransferase family protein, partial [Phycisphaeraceae bacterium]|nr:trimethylamine methyltransferase family protein [Phycisphaeraceae bacterium]
YGLGMLESGITFDFGQLVLDCEFARMIKHTVQGFRVTDETLAIGVIKEIGPGGHYLMHDHTLDGMRSQSRPELIDRQTRDVWQKAGATTAYERAVAKAQWILENHTPDPLSDEVLLRIRAIIDDTEKEMGITHE